MPNADGRSTSKVTSSSLGLVFPILVVLSVLVLIVPVPPQVLDLLLSANVTASVLILLTTISVRKPLDFSVFPSLLLTTTLFRLVLNIASTRLILTRAPFAGTDAAGVVIQAFGQYVGQGQLLVGMILFGIVVVIQFVVITKGSTRISEVAARFALDGMPGKQMAIDADLAAGLINAEQAQARRNDITDQADFYAAMDGAGKFVRGDAIAAILITIINLLGGFGIGVFQYHMTVAHAAEVFAILTIGDGLVSQVPAFLISLAAGMLATRSSRDSDLPTEAIRQTFKEPTSLFLAAVFVCGLAFTGLPMLPLLALGVGCALVGLQTKKHQNSNLVKSPIGADPGLPAAGGSTVVSTGATVGAARESRPEDRLSIEPIELVLGYKLIKLADPNSGGDLMNRVTSLRSKIAEELGIILPKVKIRDSLRLKDVAYQIKLRDVTVAAFELRSDALLAINPGYVSGDVAGIETIEPASGRPARWIDPALAEQARSLGYQVIDPAIALIGHLSEIVKSHADELLTRQQVHQLLENLSQTSPQVIGELIPDLMKPSLVHQILCNLLRERVPVRDLETILQTLGDHADRTKDPVLLTECCRRSLGRTICHQYRDLKQTLRAITLDPALEDVLAEGFEFGESGLRIKLTPQTVDGVAHELSRLSQKLVRGGYPPVVVCAAAVRPIVRQITQSHQLRLAVLSFDEITRDTQIQPQGQVPLNAIKLPMKPPTIESLNHRLMPAMA